MGEIAGDTCNITRNVTLPERSTLGRWAFLEGFKSRSQLEAWLIYEGAKARMPELAQELKQIRESRFIDKCAILLAFVTVSGVLLLSLSTDQRNQLPRRLSVRANRVKEIEA